MEGRIETKIKHPTFGHVIFYNLSPRQIEALNDLVAKSALLEDVLEQNRMLAEMLNKPATR